MRQNDEQAQQDEHDDDRREPILFAYPKEAQKFNKDACLSHNSRKRVRVRNAWAMGSSVIPGSYAVDPAPCLVARCNSAILRTYVEKLLSV